MHSWKSPLAAVTSCNNRLPFSDLSLRCYLFLWPKLFEIIGGLRRKVFDELSMIFIIPFLNRLLFWISLLLAHILGSLGDTPLSWYTTCVWWAFGYKRSSSTSVHEADSWTPTNHGRENSAAASSNQIVTNRTQQGRGQANEGHGPVSQVNLFKF